jgi:hypothetical protein
MIHTCTVFYKCLQERKKISTLWLFKELTELDFRSSPSIQGSRLSFFAQKLKTAPAFQIYRALGADLIEWAAILVEDNFLPFLVFAT